MGAPASLHDDSYLRQFCSVCNDELPLDCLQLIDCKFYCHQHAPKATPRWLDAPTCEGWWWLKENRKPVEVLHVFPAHNGELRAVWAGCEEEVPLSNIRSRGGRWLGPLTPPE